MALQAAIQADAYIQAGGMTDLAFTAVLSVALMVVSFTNRRRILRAEASLLFFGYLGYMYWRMSPI